MENAWFIPIAAKNTVPPPGTARILAAKPTTVVPVFTAAANMIFEKGQEADVQRVIAAAHGVFILAVGGEKQPA